MYQMLDILSQPGSYANEFGIGADRFAEACRNILNDTNSGRLQVLIKRLFEHAKVAELLQSPAEKAVQAVTGGA